MPQLQPRGLNLATQPPPHLSSKLAKAGLKPSVGPNPPPHSLSLKWLAGVSWPSTSTIKTPELKEEVPRQQGSTWSKTTVLFPLACSLALLCMWSLCFLTWLAPGLFSLFDPPASWLSSPLDPFLRLNLWLPDLAWPLNLLTHPDPDQHLDCPRGPRSSHPHFSVTVCHVIRQLYSLS